MKKYMARATMTVELFCEFEAEDGQDPLEVARKIDGGDFTKIPNSGDWHVYDVYEIKPPKLTPDQTRFFEAFTECMNQYPLSLEQYTEFVNGNNDAVYRETITALYDARDLWDMAQPTGEKK